MPGALAPLATAIITKELDTRKRVALVAASSVIPEPLGLAAAVVAVQRARSEDVDQTGGEALAPEMVQVPLLVGDQVDQARDKLKKLGLKEAVVLHVSRLELKGRVFQQNPEREQWKPIGSTVTLHVHDGPAPAPDEGLRDVLRNLRNEVVALRAELHELRQGAQLAGAAVAAHMTEVQGAGSTPTPGQAGSATGSTPPP